MCVQPLWKRERPFVVIIMLSCLRNYQMYHLTCTSFFRTVIQKVQNAIIRDIVVCEISSQFVIIQNLNIVWSINDSDVVDDVVTYQGTQWGESPLNHRVP